MPDFYQIGRSVENHEHRISRIEWLIKSGWRTARLVIVLLIWGVGLFFNASLSLLLEATELAMKAFGI